jgi:putative tricarboxylic transport membrane protein
MSETDERPARRGLRSDQFSGLMLLALALYVGWENREYPIGTLMEPGPGYLPLLLVIFLGAVGLLIALWGIKSPPLASIRWNDARRAILILLACGLATVALERIGYRITIMALMIFLLGVLERKGPVAVVLVSVGFSLISFYVVGDLLHVPLPRSPWGF